MINCVGSELVGENERCVNTVVAVGVAKGVRELISSETRSMMTTKENAPEMYDSFVQHSICRRAVHVLGISAGPPSHVIEMHTVFQGMTV